MNLYKGRTACGSGRLVINQSGLVNSTFRGQPPATAGGSLVEASNQKQKRSKRPLTKIYKSITAAIIDAVVQPISRACRLEEEASKEKEAKDENQGVYDDFDKTHEINYPLKSLERLRASN